MANHEGQWGHQQAVGLLDCAGKAPVLRSKYCGGWTAAKALFELAGRLNIQDSRFRSCVALRLPPHATIWQPSGFNPGEENG
jgi:hypothetical protein